MSTFTAPEAAYLAEGGHLGRLATIDPDGMPHVVPLGWSHNTELDTIDIGGRDADAFVSTRKFRNVRANERVAFVVDDVLPEWQPRAVMVRGRAEAVHEPDADPVVALIRITPTEVVSWGLDT